MIGTGGPPTVTGRPPAVPAKPPKARRRRGRFHRRHTPHYYLVLTALGCAPIVCLLDAASYFGRSIRMAQISFVAASLTTVVVLGAFFWGFCLLLTVNISAERLRFVVPHAAVGTLAPLLYSLNISFAVQNLGDEPVGLGLFITSCFSLLLLLLQFSMGKGVVYCKPLHVLPGGRGRARHSVSRKV